MTCTVCLCDGLGVSIFLLMPLTLSFPLNSHTWWLTTQGHRYGPRKVFDACTQCFLRPTKRTCWFQFGTDSADRPPDPPAWQPPVPGARSRAKQTGTRMADLRRHGGIFRSGRHYPEAWLKANTRSGHIFASQRGWGRHRVGPTTGTADMDGEFRRDSGRLLLHYYLRNWAGKEGRKKRWRMQKEWERKADCDIRNSLVVTGQLLLPSKRENQVKFSIR
ncbi:hypothetical protein N657DRAFT_349792 [Parathielavia appendiculata]|uniref:Uncharacterized protein n=1 Tax=Parathielavia appendiculata TaxID=2587402 RepID=A0AAN6U238_9PEZI|nr:hypothetical protein N657DRAFT_349792 [Parathielavia appendiculata]